MTQDTLQRQRAKEIDAAFNIYEEILHEWRCCKGWGAHESLDLDFREEQRVSAAVHEKLLVFLETEYGVSQVGLEERNRKWEEENPE